VKAGEVYQIITLEAQACFDDVLRSISANAARRVTRRSEAQTGSRQDEHAPGRPRAGGGADALRL